MRLFVAVPLGDAVVCELTAMVARLRPGTSGLRWTAPESWHITLQFLGSTSPEQLECLMTGLAEVRSAPVTVQVGKLGCFDRAGVFFADVAVSQGLLALQERVVEATGRCGFAAEARPFHPHITLARAKGDGRGAELRQLGASIHAQPVSPRFTAREFLLYESHLGAGGAKYEVRGRFGLAGAPS